MKCAFVDAASGGCDVYADCDTPPRTVIMAAMPSTHRAIALFPGTFDPLTNGHLDLIRRAVAMFDVVVGIGTNPEKRELFTPPQRRDMIRHVLADEKLPDIRVEIYDGLTVDFAKRIGAIAILRGIRNLIDLNFEFQLALTNRAVADVETVFIMADEAHGFTSSTLIKQIAASGRIEHLKRLLPPLIVRHIEQKLQTDRDALRSLAKDAHKE